MVPLHVEEWRESGWIARYVAEEPLRLNKGWCAEVEEMVGAARNAGGFGPGEIGGEVIVDPIAAFGGLDEHEVDAIGARRRPVDLALVFGNIRAVHRIAMRRTAFEIDRISFRKVGPRNADILRGAFQSRAGRGAARGHDCGSEDKSGE